METMRSAWCAMAHDGEDLGTVSHLGDDEIVALCRQTGADLRWIARAQHLPPAAQRLLLAGGPDVVRSLVGCRNFDPALIDQLRDLWPAGKVADTTITSAPVARFLIERLQLVWTDRLALSARLDPAAAVFNMTVRRFQEATLAGKRRLGGAVLALGGGHLPAREDLTDSEVRAIHAFGAAHDPVKQHHLVTNAAIPIELFAELVAIGLPGPVALASMTDPAKLAVTLEVAVTWGQTKVIAAVLGNPHTVLEPDERYALADSIQVGWYRGERADCAVAALMADPDRAERYLRARNLPGFTGSPLGRLRRYCPHAPAIALGCDPGTFAALAGDWNATLGELIEVCTAVTT